MHQIDNSHTSAMQQSNSTYAGMYSLKNSFVNRKKSKIVVSSGHSTPFKMAGQKTIIPSDPLCEAYSQYVFVPFNTKLADDKQIKHIMLKQIEAENMEKPEIYKADNSPRIESAMATKHSKRAIKLSSSKSSLQGKAKIITAASKTMKKLGKVNENKIRFHKTDAHMTSVDHIDESRDGDFRRLIKTGLSKSFISKQLNSSMHDLAIYKDEVNNRMVRLQRDLSEKIRSSHRMEACLSRYTVKIPKDKVMPPANSENASVDVKGIEEMSIQKNGNRKFGHNMIESEVLSYGCLLHKACFLNVYPMTRSNPVIAVFTVDNPKSSQQENRMMCFGGLGLKLMNDCYYLNLDKMKWIPVVDYSNPQTSSPQFRVGSVHVKFKNSVYIFGGSKLAHSGLITDYWNEALVYELAKDRWSTIKYTYDGGIGRAAPRPSKFSGGSLIKDKVVISGGVNHEGDFIDDYWIFYFGSRSVT